MPETPDPTGPDEREALDYTDIANRVQAETGRSLWPSTVEAIVKHLPAPRPVTVSEEAIEAAARAMYDENRGLYVNADQHDAAWSSNRDAYLALLRAALPHLTGGQSEAVHIGLVHKGGNRLRGPIEMVLDTHLAKGWTLEWVGDVDSARGDVQ